MSEPHASSPVVARISRDALRHNARLLARLGPPARLMAVVKADGYGHGAVEVARTLEADGVGAFAVAHTSEAAALRAAGVSGAILVFGQPFEDDLAAASALDLDVMAGSLEAVRRIEEAARVGAPLRVHAKVETGLNRLGLDPAEVPEALRRLRDAPGVTVAGLWSHLATSDAFADVQADALAAFDGLAPDVPRHLTASGPLVDGHGVRVDSRGFVRCGIALYGLAPDGNPATPARVGLRPALALESRVVRLRTLAPGETVSYGRRFVASQPTRIATVSVGYADGLPRLLSNRGWMGIDGQRAPIAGVVCMDMTMLDLGDPAGPMAASVREGDRVAAMGPGGPSLEEVAAWAETIPYEIATGLGSRVPRVYVD
ncbi:MAG: alanine racemase [Bacteroidetes bacterium]|nr:alanine racemase [Bacteroidota bacterium]